MRIDDCRRLEVEQPQDPALPACGDRLGRRQGSRFGGYGGRDRRGGPTAAGYQQCERKTDRYQRGGVQRR